MIHYLIIDDEPIAHRIIENYCENLMHLEKKGNCYNAFEAIEFLNENSVDLLFLDINMPKLNGMELRNKVHQNEDLRLKSIPYLFFTTSAEQQSVIDAYSKSIQGFFIKPVTYDDLLRVIRNIVEYWKDCQSPNVVNS